MLKKSYTLNINDLDNIEYAPLIRLLRHNGITFEQTLTDWGLQTVMTVNAEKLDQMNRQNAGVKEKSLFLTEAAGEPVYVSEIRQLQKDGLSMKEIANMYNVSRATLYRRIKEAGENGTDQII